MRASIARVAGLLLASGMCALVFQVAWFREFRLVFGASTAASAAVTAIFMGGLGLGNAVLGRRADRHPNPLAYYARLELAVAVTAALSPMLIDLARGVYVTLGGQLALGFVGATAVRLLLAALSIALPTFLMGGTLPAAARSVTTPADENRRSTAVLYGLNTLGAVLGALGSTFLAIELLGTRKTLWLACAVNLCVSAGAFALARATAISAPPAADAERPRRPQRGRQKPPAAAVPNLPAPVVYAAAAIVGFAFFVMELVWYRMLGPLLGGSTFTFGLILAVALSGIGLGGAAYAMIMARRRATPAGFALTCALESACIALPFALGDRLALWAAGLQAANSTGFVGELLAWAAVASVVILPAALLAGIQFPLLIALLGRADEQLGRQIGMAVAWNTVGDIAGSLAGGFGLLPLLSAPGAWRAAVILLGALSVAILMTGVRTGRRPGWLLLPVGSLVVAAIAICTPGPSAVWRHSGIGAGRARVPTADVNALREWTNETRGRVVWETDGVESSVAITRHHGLTFLVGGKSDGNSLGDASTQIMLGLVPGILHPHPQTAFVIGLGTGETAGWLAEMPGVQRVDVVELEPAVDEMARRCAAVNFHVLAHPKVRRIYNDAREVLLTSPDRYDLIISEPSNPYRSGVASLFTREFYLAGRRRLNPGGIFAQWVQGYEVDAQTVRVICATLRAVYPQVEIWQSSESDLLLLASEEPIAYPLAELRRRIASEPCRTALAGTWGAVDVEGFLARYVGGRQLVDHDLASQPVTPNTDDHNTIEYGFARTLGQKGRFPVLDLRRMAIAIQGHRAPVSGGQVDWTSVGRQWRVLYATRGSLAFPLDDQTAEELARWQALALAAKRDWQGAIERWQSRQPASPGELAWIAWSRAELGDRAALPLVERLRAIRPAEAEAVQGILFWHQRQLASAARSLAAAFGHLRSTPWATPEIIVAALETALLVSHTDPRLAPELFAAIEGPFAADYADGVRRRIACRMAALFERKAAVRLLESFEPYPPWTRSFLKLRRQEYTAAAHPLAAQAAADFDEFLAVQGR